jgi:hypothetical protein
MEIVDNAESWLMRVCVKRGIKAAIIALSAYVTSHGLDAALLKHGVTVDWAVLQASSIAAACAGLEMLHDYLKVKKGISWL